MIIDTHAHIHNPPLSDDIEGIIERAAEKGVKKIVTVGTSLEDSKNALSFALNHNNIFAAAGIHPEETENYSESDLGEIKKIALNKKVIAVGEVGLDYYRDYAAPERQKKLFRAMINIAKEVNKPLVIHCREAEEDTINILNDELFGGKGRGGVFHCFSGNRNMLKWALNNNFYISFAGNVTYKSAGNIREALKYVPLDRILTETDSPYLAPIPKRGRTNEPSYVFYTASFIAEELKIPLEELEINAENNFTRLFLYKTDI